MRSLAGHPPDAGAATRVEERDQPRALVALCLFLLPLGVYGALVGRWSFDRDEYYTLVDSSKSVAELLAYEIKPLYYLICHALLSADLEVGLEVLLRAPAVVAASLVAPLSYWLLSSRGQSRGALFVAVLVLANPWVFEHSQVARFYSLMLLGATVATIALYRWLDDPRPRWWVVFGVALAVATAAQSTAAPLGPAAIAGVVAACWLRHPAALGRVARVWGPWIAGSGVVVAFLGWLVVRDQFALWLGSEAGQYGNYSNLGILGALLVHGGPPLWALAFLPLLKPASRWRPHELFLAITAIGTILPFLGLSYLGGGVAPRYLLAALPAVFILAGRHWASIDHKLPTRELRLALAGGLLAFYLPYLASIASDGDHYDYRSAAAFVDSQLRDDTIVISSAHLMLGHYLDDPREIDELTDFGDGVPRERLVEVIARAQAEKRPLLVVSREDRSLLSASDQEWFHRRFALIRSFENPRFDHRRFRLAVYEYRPASTHATEQSRLVSDTPR